MQSIPASRIRLWSSGKMPTTTPVARIPLVDRRPAVFIVVLGEAVSPATDVNLPARSDTPARTRFGDSKAEYCPIEWPISSPCDRYSQTHGPLSCATNSSSTLPCGGSVAIQSTASGFIGAGEVSLPWQSAQRSREVLVPSALHSRADPVGFHRAHKAPGRRPRCASPAQSWSWPTRRCIAPFHPLVSSGAHRFAPREERTNYQRAASPRAGHAPNPQFRRRPIREATRRAERMDGRRDRPGTRPIERLAGHHGAATRSA
jgi:hypothetical protein